MKRYRIIFVTLILAIGFCATSCGSDDKHDDEPGAEQPENTSIIGRWYYGFESDSEKWEENFVFSVDGTYTYSYVDFYDNTENESWSGTYVYDPENMTLTLTVNGSSQTILFRRVTIKGDTLNMLSSDVSTVFILYRR